ncbi:MAG TPA: tetratricopeptide repeat protein [Terracidiphilus sp.]|nr:tetratricopeptide repeat protein [Terracidiphilus sp.]
MLYLALAIALAGGVTVRTACQTATEGPGPAPTAIDSLGLPGDAAAQLKAAMAQHDSVGAEKLLLAEIAKDPHSQKAAHLLAFAGSVYFLDSDFLNAAIAWKKSEAIAPLEPTLQFSLAMAYVRIGHPEWARPLLTTLGGQEPKNSIFPYWLGRLDYDAHDYSGATQHFQKAIQLAPGMARAYDNLGLCYFYQNENALAVDNFKKAIALDLAAAHPSAWPYLNLAVAQQFLNKSAEAEANLREALRLDPKFAQAHFQLGSVLEGEGKLQESLAEYHQAAQLDTNYAEPHMAMARVYRKLGQKKEAQEEVQTYLSLHPKAEK